MQQTAVAWLRMQERKATTHPFLLPPIEVYSLGTQCYSIAIHGRFLTHAFKRAQMRAILSAPTEAVFVRQGGLT